MYVLGNGRINNGNKLGYVLGKVNGGPWFTIVVDPQGVVVDPSSGARERVNIYGGKNLSEHRRSVTFAPIAGKLLCYASQFKTRIWFDGLFLVAQIEDREGKMAFAKVYLENGIIWKDVLETIGEAIWKAEDNYWRMVNMCFKVLDGPKTYQVAVAIIGNRTFSFT